LQKNDEKQPEDPMRGGGVELP